MGAFREFERYLIIKRTTNGLASARAGGRVGSLPKGISPAAQQNASIASALYEEGRLSVSEICSQIGISKPTLYKYLKGSGVLIETHYPANFIKTTTWSAIGIRVK